MSVIVIILFLGSLLVSGHQQTVMVTGGLFCANIPKYAEGRDETHGDVVSPFTTQGLVLPMDKIHLELWEKEMCKIT